MEFLKKKKKSKNTEITKIYTTKSTFYFLKFKSVKF